jgi:hypothetical protein
MKLTVIIRDYFRVKKSLPEDFRKKPEASFMTAIVSASRRQMQMRGSPFNSFFDAIPGMSTELIFAYRFKADGIKSITCDI